MHDISTHSPLLFRSHLRKKTGATSVSLSPAGRAANAAKTCGSIRYATQRNLCRTDHLPIVGAIHFELESDLAFGRVRQKHEMLRQAQVLFVCEAGCVSARISVLKTKTKNSLVQKSSPKSFQFPFFQEVYTTFIYTNNCFRTLFTRRAMKKQNDLEE